MGTLVITSVPLLIILRGQRPTILVSHEGRISAHTALGYGVKGLRYETLLSDLDDAG